MRPANRYATHRTVHPDVLAHVTAVLDRIDHVLEVGCGTGSYAAALNLRTGPARPLQPFHQCRRPLPRGRASASRVAACELRDAV